MTSAISHFTVDGIWTEPSNSITELESFSILCTTGTCGQDPMLLPLFYYYFFF